MESIIRHSVLSEARVTLGPRPAHTAASPKPNGHPQPVEKPQAPPVASPVPAGGFSMSVPMPAAALEMRATQPTMQTPQREAPVLAAEPGRADGASQSHAAALIDRLEEELRELRTDLEGRRDEAVQAGFEEGRRRGAAQYEEKLAHLGRLLERMEERIEAGFADLAEPVVEVVYEAVCKIAGEAGVSRDFVAGAVGQAVRRVARDLPVSISISPQSHALIEPYLADGTGLLAADRVSWKLDPSMLPGGCVISTPAGGLDARLDTQLRRLREVLLAHPPQPREGA